MQHIEIFPSHPADAPGLVVVLLRVTQFQAVHWRKFRATAGTPLPDLQREAERMALQRWPGEMSVRLMLPIGDCGRVPE